MLLLPPPPPPPAFLDTAADKLYAGTFSPIDSFWPLPLCRHHSLWEAKSFFSFKLSNSSGGSVGREGGVSVMNGAGGTCPRVCGAKSSFPLLNQSD